MMELLRTLGISMELPGSQILKEFILEKAKPEDLTKKQREEVLIAWDSRHYVPTNKLKYADRVRPEKNLEREEYEKEYVKLIYNYLKVQMI